MSDYKLKVWGTGVGTWGHFYVELEGPNGSTFAGKSSVDGSLNSVMVKLMMIVSTTYK